LFCDAFGHRTFRRLSAITSFLVMPLAQDGRSVDEAASFAEMIFTGLWMCRSGTAGIQRCASFLRAPIQALCASAVGGGLDQLADSHVTTSLNWSWTAQHSQHY
jgi:hypothetical protein